MILDDKPQQKLSSFGNVRVGDTVVVLGWRYPGSRDLRTVEDMYRAKCQHGVMVRLNRPLTNGSTNVSIGWLEDWR